MVNWKSKSAKASEPGSLSQDTIVMGDITATDTMSEIRWSPAANHLAASSWDGRVRIYDVTGNIADQTARNIRGLAEIQADGPVLSCDWSKDGSIIAAAGADKKVHLLDAHSGQTISFAAHDAPIRSVRFVDIRGVQSPILATGSWDQTLRYWDARAGGDKPIAVVGLAERVYSMDTARDLLVAATADRKIHLVDLAADPTRVHSVRDAVLQHKKPETQLELQTRVVAAMPDGKGWATGSIAGRCAFNYVDKHSDNIDAYAFKCHRDTTSEKGVTKIWALNTITFHPTHTDVFGTGGSDGIFAFWHQAARQRLKHFAAVSTVEGIARGAEPGVAGITAAAFSRADGGGTFAYAVGYDWSMGYAKNTPDTPVRLVLHHVAEDEIAKKKL